MDSFERCEEDHFPPKEAFYSKLNWTHIRDEDYAYAQSVWNTLNIHTVGEYHDLYLKSMLQSTSHILFSYLHRTPLEEPNSYIAWVADVMLFTDVFEMFRSVSMINGKFEVDAAHYVSARQIA